MAEAVYFSVRELPVGGESGVVGRLSPLEFKGKVEREITDFGKQDKDLHKGSITAGDEAALFNAYLLSKLGQFEPTKDQAEVFDYLFNKIGKGNICDNAVDYDNGDKSLKKPNDSYMPALWIIEPEEFDLDGGGRWKAIGGEAKNKIIPPIGYVGRTCDGAYDIDGAPRETWATRKQAEKTWTDAGFPEDFARMAVSHFYPRNERRGTAAVARVFFRYDSGRFDLAADGFPSNINLDIGRLSVSKSE